MYVTYSCKFHQRSISFALLECLGENADVPPAILDANTTQSTIPSSMSNLDLTKYILLKKLLENAVPGKDDVGRDTRFIHGAVHQGLPTDPKLPSGVAYIQGSLPSPELGSIPRDEIYDELRNNPSKEAKQRRDFGIPDADTVSFPVLY